jgi:hypothetical protein
VIRKHGFRADLSDEAIFRLSDAKGDCIGVLAIHVDDTIGGGTAAFHRIMEAVADDLKVGSKESSMFCSKMAVPVGIWEVGRLGNFWWFGRSRFLLFGI